MPSLAEGSGGITVIGNVVALILTLFFALILVLALQRWIPSFFVVRRLLKTCLKLGYVVASVARELWPWTDSSIVPSGLPPVRLREEVLLYRFGSIVLENRGQDARSCVPATLDTVPGKCISGA